MNARFPRHPLVYEINARVWLAEMSRGRGRPVSLAQVEETDIRRLSERGFHAVWLMGVWEPSPAGRRIARRHPALRAEYRRVLPDVSEEDILGSPYCVRAYRVPRALGGMAGLAAFCRKLRAHNLRLILDFVPNHLARDHEWLEAHPELFIRGREEDIARESGNYFRGPGGRIFAHGKDPHFPAWIDTVQLNYAHPETRRRMRGELTRLARLCDGVRCDMAMLILPKVFRSTWERHLEAGASVSGFWEDAIASVKAERPDFLFIAEAYWGLEETLQEAGFDFTYDKGLYDRLREGDAGGVRAQLSRAVDVQSRCVRFIENHDEPRAAKVFGEGRLAAAAAVALLAPGMKLLHEGQLEGRRIKIPVQLGRRPPEEADAGAAEVYRRLLGVLADPVFQAGSFRLEKVNAAGEGDDTHRSLVAFSGTRRDASAGRPAYLIVVNLGGRTAYGRIPLPGEAFAGGSWGLRDRFDGARYEREGKELIAPGLFVARDAGGVHLFEIGPA